jgi:hypothetical protein
MSKNGLASQITHGVLLEGNRYRVYMPLLYIYVFLCPGSCSYIATSGDVHINISSKHYVSTMFPEDNQKPYFLDCLFNALYLLRLNTTKFSVKHNTLMLYNNMLHVSVHQYHHRAP